MNGRGQLILGIVIVAAAIAAPLIFPAFRAQIAMLWIMVLFALTWD
ncbi:MAG: branched-chain amino acid ABC transporter permease, partial [Rhodospirillaceae bacterium]|nr:branched-chain amino acid ABC transporter permease [Rhodospirillaceae bacterium]